MLDILGSTRKQRLFLSVELRRSMILATGSCPACNKRVMIYKGIIFKCCSEFQIPTLGDPIFLFLALNFD